MSDEMRVWIRKRKLKPRCRCRGPCKCRERCSYDLRWIDPQTGTWKSRHIGRDRKVAERAAAKLEGELAAGSCRDTKRVAWSAFVDEVVGFIKGRHAEEAVRTLTEFGDMFSPRSPSVVMPNTVRSYVQQLEQKGNAPTTVNKKLRYLRLAFRVAVENGYIAECPVRKTHWRKELKRDDDERRILQPEEEQALLASCDKLYGLPLRAFAEFTLETWGRLSEVTSLTWDDVDLREPSVCFRNTKSHEDRYVPLDPKSGVVDKLRRLQAMTLRDGGPFTRYADRSNLHKKWTEVVKHAEIEHITIHDLRRTGITRALLDNMPITVVKDLAGHHKIETTMRYYKGIKKRNLREAVANGRRVAG